MNDMEDQKKEQELHKSMECVKCKHLFDCKGKPRDIDKCLNFEERGGDLSLKEECLLNQ